MACWSLILGLVQRPSAGFPLVATMTAVATMPAVATMAEQVHSGKGHGKKYPDPVR